MKGVRELDTLVRNFSDINVCLNLPRACVVLYRQGRCDGAITCTGPILVASGWQTSNGIRFSRSTSVSPRHYQSNMLIFVFIFV